MSSERKLIEKNAMFSGATHYQNGVALGAMLFHAGVIRGAEMMAASDDPTKLLEKLKPPVVFATDTPANDTKDNDDLTGSDLGES
jgi:hypothetical protein